MQQGPQEDGFEPIPKGQSIQDSSPRDTPEGGSPATSEPTSASQAPVIKEGAPSEFSVCDYKAEDPTVQVHISFVSLNHNSPGLPFEPG